MFLNNFKKNKKGQVMIIVSLSLGGVMMISSLVGGILILNQLRQSKNIIDSTKAIYAADAALEYGFYQFKGNNRAENPILNNQTQAITKCFDKDMKNIDCKDSENVVYIIGKGQTSLITRAFQMSF